jgi:hypothetical protein
MSACRLSSLAARADSTAVMTSCALARAANAAHLWRHDLDAPQRRAQRRAAAAAAAAVERIGEHAAWGVSPWRRRRLRLLVLTLLWLMLCRCAARENAVQLCLQRLLRPQPADGGSVKRKCVSSSRAGEDGLERCEARMLLLPGAIATHSPRATHTPPHTETRSAVEAQCTCRQQIPVRGIQVRRRTRWARS